MAEVAAPSPRLDYIRAFDGIRAFAVIIVFFSHALYGYYSQGGFLGVDLFFVLSGYLITGLLLKEFRQTGTIDFRVFYQHRACRLLPAMVVALLLAALVWRFQPDSHRTGFPAAAAATLLFYANFVYNYLGPLKLVWSLSVEEQFYFLWPLTLFLLLRGKSFRRMAGTAMALVLFCFLLRLILQIAVAREQMAFYPLLVTRMDSLLLGALAAMVAGREKTRAAADFLARVRLPEIFVAALLIFFVWGGIWLPLFYGGFTVVAFLAALLLTCLAESHRPSLLRRFFESTPMVWIGRRSYGIYLYHLSLLLLLEPLRAAHSVTNFVAVTVVRIVVVLAVAAISYRWIERPVLNLKWRVPPRAA